MPTLDNLGKISAVTMVVYIPILIIATILVCRHGFTRDAGWIFLAIFSLTRIIGGATLIAAEEIRPVVTTLYIVGIVLESAGLSPLMLATLGFIKTIVQNSLPNPALFTRAFRLLGLLATIALALSIYGSTETSPSTVSNGSTLRRVGSLLFLALYLLLAALHGYCWANVARLMKHRRTLLVAISAALPFLGVRVVYSVLSAFSGPLSFSGTAAAAPASTGFLAKFSMLTGSWPIYLCMSVLMELVVVVIYTTAGARIPLQQDYVQQAKFADDEPLYGMGPTGPGYQAPYQAPYAAPYGSSPYAQQEHIAYAPPPRA
ncbi:hypothetical protein HWV62_40334 [Athelia sp. TMB]|nr:hypothetical protein HWV62_40334 [Athelia sp. TMB]